MSGNCSSTSNQQISGQDDGNQSSSVSQQSTSGSSSPNHTHSNQQSLEKQMFQSPQNGKNANSQNQGSGGAQQPDVTSDHTIPICLMGDIELYLRAKQQKFFQYQANQGNKNANPYLLYVRDPQITDEENALLNRFYCGNPFIAPGTLGAKGRRKNGWGWNVMQIHDSDELQDEAFLYNTQADLSVLDNEETVMPAQAIQKT